MWRDWAFPWLGGGSVLLVGIGSKPAKDALRIFHCLRTGRSEVKLSLILDFNDLVRAELKARARRQHQRVIWPTKDLPEGGHGLVHQHKDHPVEFVRVWQQVAKEMVDEVRRFSVAHGRCISVIIVSGSSFSGHTPISRYTMQLLAAAFPQTVRVAWIEVPRELVLLENLRDLGTTYPDPQNLGVRAVILTEQPEDPMASDEQDWQVAFGFSVLIGGRRMRLRQPAAGDALSTLARFSKGFIRVSLAAERNPLIPWPFPFGPYSRLSRADLAAVVGSAIAAAIRKARADGANEQLPWYMTIGVPLYLGSPLWRGRLQSEALAKAIDLLKSEGWPSNIEMIWSALATNPRDDNGHAPVPVMILWPSQANPDPLIAKHLTAPSLLPQSSAPTVTPPAPEESSNGAHAEPVPDHVLVRAEA